MNPSADVQSGVLLDRKICVTGRLLSLTHDELHELVLAHGGVFLRGPRRCGFTLVIGDDGWPSRQDGSPTSVFDRARKLRALGYPVEFVSEDEFLDCLGHDAAASAIRGQHTLSDLSRILDVPSTTIRRWMQQGLIEPVRLQCRLAYFDFHQVASAKRICELLRAGATLAEIRDGVEQIRQWLPDSKLPLVELARLQRNATLFRRGGELLDGSGQRHFDFDSVGGMTTAIPTAAVFAVDQVSPLFEQALQMEDDGQLEQSAALYRKAIELDPVDPILNFNLGNVLYALSQFEQASACYRQALDGDPAYVEAWNNLGNALAVAGRMEAAVEAFQRALKLVPIYADAHYNLADVLERLGRSDESDDHRRAYQRYSSADRFQAGNAQFLRLVRDEG